MERRQVVMMFSGQGAQYYQMGRELYNNDATFCAAIDRCDVAAVSICGRRVSEIIFERPISMSDQFDDQRQSTAALLAVGYGLAQALFDRGVRPDYLLGYSLGELIAATVSGILSIEEAFALLARCATLYERAVRPSTLVAVLDACEILEDMGEIKSFCELAAINAPRHFVLAVSVEHLSVLARVFDEKAVVWSKLPVQFGFHASFIDPVETAFRALQPSSSRRTSTIPIVSCVTGAPVTEFTADHLWSVVRKPVLFQATVRRLATETPTCFIDAGPSGTLAAFVNQNLLPDTVAVPTINQFGADLKAMAQIEAMFQ
jgi:bacillaene synthase trans-acting acyltransferase